MGSVYLARDAQLDRLVAIKLLKDDYSDDAELRQRFHREARSIARLRHPNIVTVFDVGEHEGRPFMAMEYIAGDTLTVWLRRSPPPPLPRRLALVEELCAGLAHAHEAGMVHRDIKPNNLMVDADGVLKILDFGIARARMMIGSLNYMSPEQVTGGNVDYRADVFAAGVVLYEVIALEQAFSGSLDSGVLHRIMTVGPVPLQERVPGIDSDLVRITERALARDPGDRYQHASEMRKDLAAVRQRLDLDPSATSVLSTPAPSTSSPAPADTRLPRAAMTADRLRELSRQQVEEHVQAARRALDAGDFRLALDRAERSALLEPDNSAVIGLLERVRFEYQAAAVRQALIEAKQLLAEGSLDRAAALVERVPSLSGPEPRATELNDQVVGLLSEIGQAREQQSRRHARERYEEQSRTAGAVKTPPAAGSSPPLRPPSPPPPTAAGDADENAPHIVVRLASHRNSSLPRSEEAVELVGRDRELQALVHRILRSHGGSFLVTGYRGVGKTSFVNGVVRRLDDEARSEPGLRLLIVRINLPKPIE